MKNGVSLWFGKPIKSNQGITPLYVYHYNDFSPTRAEMLKKEIKVSDSKKQIEEIYANEILEKKKVGRKFKKYFLSKINQ